MIAKIKQIKEAVKNMLTAKPKTRDNDFLLILKMWADQNPQLRNPNYSFKQFGIDFRDGKYAHPETITRARRLAQSDDENLKGKTGKARKEAEIEVRKYINR